MDLGCQVRTICFLFFISYVVHDSQLCVLVLMFIEVDNSYKLNDINNVITSTWTMAKHYEDVI